MIDFLLLSLLGYLCGSLSSAIIVCKVMRLPDPRSQGSKNPGATNVMRIGGKKAAYTTFLGDFLKGVIPVLLAKWVFDSDLAIAGAALGAFLGHLYPLYFGFKGGKGVATLAGVLVAVSWKVFLICGLCWLVIFFASRYVSLASMVGAVAAAIGAMCLGLSAPLVVLFWLLAALVIFRHKENIIKLKNGTENRFGKRQK